MTLSELKVGDKVIMEWQPIETAPKDGTRIMVWPPTWIGTASCARWNEDRHAKNPRPYWSRIDDHGRITISREKQPTHWAPLPCGPNGESA